MYGGRYATPSKHLLLRFKRLSYARSICEFASWWKNQVLSERMAKDRGQPSSPSLDSVRLPPSLQKRFGKFLESTPTDKLSSKVIDNELFRLSKAFGSSFFDKQSREETMYCKDETPREGVFFKSLSCTKEIGGLEISDRPVTVKQISYSRNISDGHPSESQESTPTGHVGDVDRSVRRLSSHPHKGVRSMLPMFSGRRHQVPIPSAALRPDASALAVHRGGQAAEEVGSQTLSGSFSVPGRLVKPASFQGDIGTVHKDASRPMCKVGSVGKSPKVRTYSSTTHCVSGGSARPKSGKSVCYSREGTKRPVIGTGNDFSSVSASIPSRDYVGKADSFISDCSMGQTPSQVFPERSSEGCKARKGSQSSGIPFRKGQTTTQVLVEPYSMEGGHPLSAPSVRDDHLHGCFPVGVGDSLSEQFISRQLGQQRSPHKLVRAEDSPDCITTTSVRGKRQGSHLYGGQYHGSSVCQPTRGNEVSSIARLGGADRSAGKKPQLHSDSQAHHRELECAGRPSLTSRPSSVHGVETVSAGFRMAGQTVTMGEADLRAVCKQHEPPATKVCVPVPGPQSVGDRCPVMPVASGVSPVRVPTSTADRTVSSSPSSGKKVPVAAGSAMVTVRQVGTPTELVASLSTDTISSDAQLADPAPLASQLPQPSLGKLDPSFVGEDRLKKLGYSDAVIKRLALAYAASTQVQYRSKWISFVSWAEKQSPRAYDPTSPTLLLLTEYLAYLFQDKHLSVGTIANYRSAISYYWKRFFNFEVSPEDEILRDLFRGFQRERPPAKKRVVGWDLKFVLEFFSSGRFKNWESLSDKELTLKTVFLLALASGKRRGELHALTREGIEERHGEVAGRVLYPSESFISKTHLKTSGLGALKSVFIPALSIAGESEGLLCPVKCLDIYLNRSDKYRSDEQKQLFISWVPGLNKDVRAQTISGYIKASILLAYEEVPNDSELMSSLQVVPHTVRHVATSLKALRHFSLDEVLAAGGWVTPNSFISHYLQNFSKDTVTGLCSLGGFIAAGSHC